MTFNKIFLNTNSFFWDLYLQYSCIKGEKSTLQHSIKIIIVIFSVIVQNISFKWNLFQKLILNKFSLQIFRGKFILGKR